MPPLNSIQKSFLALSISNALVAMPTDAATINVGANCSLIDAIESANTDTSVGMCGQGLGADIIVLPANHVASYTAGIFSYLSTAGYTYDSALPTITSDVTLQGTAPFNAVIERAGTTAEFRVLAVEANASLSLEFITVRGGKLSGPNSSGAGIYANEANLDLQFSTISNNQANRAAGIDLQYCSNFYVDDSIITNNSASTFSGGVYAKDPATVSITNSTISANSSGSSGAGIMIIGYGTDVGVSDSRIFDNKIDNPALGEVGGGIYVLGVTLNLTDVTLFSNLAFNGGGLSAEDSTVVINKSTLSGNTALADGGAIQGDNTLLEITRSTIFGNTAIGEAGGINQIDGGSIKIRNSTLSGNIAATGSALSSAAATVEIRGSTIYDNSTTAIGVEAASVLLAALPDVLVNTIIAGSSLVDCNFGVGLPTFPNAASWFEDASCDGVGQGKPLLNPLMDNNDGLLNSTLTHAPSLGSGVLGIADTGVCALYGAIDQRGAARGAITCDIGAVEGSVAGAFDETCFVVKAANGNVITFCL